MPASTPQALLESLKEQLETFRDSGLYKEERVITSPQKADIHLQSGQHVLNFCSNNYLGLADHPDLIAAAKKGYDDFGFGLASVRFICGTQSVHKELEQRLSQYLGKEDTILYSSCFDANGGLFECLLGPEDAIISDELNHASIIDGIRLCKAQRYRYKNNDLADLEKKLREAGSCRYKLIATDGVFSMDGIIARLDGICDLAEKYGALVMVDDCHATGFLGPTGRGSMEHCGVLDRVDIVTSTLGKAMGGASGGFTSGKREVIQWLRQRSRPYLFSNTLSPSIAAASLAVLNLLENGRTLRETLRDNAQYFRGHMTDLGFQLVPGEHPIIPVMLGEAKLASDFADQLLREGVYVIGFSYPVVPKGKARIRTQISAGHTRDQLDRALTAFEKVGHKLGVI